jgi:hypothetical protein
MSWHIELVIQKPPDDEMSAERFAIRSVWQLIIPVNAPSFRFTRTGEKTQTMRVVYECARGRRARAVRQDARSIPPNLGVRP